MKPLAAAYLLAGCTWAAADIGPVGETGTCAGNAPIVLGPPPCGDFVRPEQVGTNYVSPWGEPRP